MKYFVVLGSLVSLSLAILVSGGCAEQQTLWTIDIGQQKKVIADSNDAIANNPRDAEAYYKRGEAYHLLEQYDEAIADFSKAIEIDPRFERAYEGRADAYLGLIYLGTDKTEAAEADLKMAEKIDPTIFNDQKNRGFGYVSVATNEFIFPVVDSEKRHREGDVIPGSTTMRQIVELLPGWPGHGPSPMSEDEKPTWSGKVNETVNNLRYSYNPMVAGDHVFGFDGNERLVFILVYLPHSLSSESDASKYEQQKMKDMMKQYRFEELERDEGVIYTSGDIAPCITAVLFDPEPEEEPITHIAYFFTCPTK